MSTVISNRAPRAAPGLAFLRSGGCLATPLVDVDVAVTISIKGLEKDCNLSNHKRLHCSLGTLHETGHDHSSVGSYQGENSNHDKAAVRQRKVLGCGALISCSGCKSGWEYNTPRVLTVGALGSSGDSHRGGRITLKVGKPGSSACSPGPNSVKTCPAV